MAKYQNKKSHEGKITTITTPSFYGSHLSMVVEELGDEQVRCKDDVGEYVTTKDRLDSGLADPARWSRSR